MRRSREPRSIGNWGVQTHPPERVVERERADVEKVGHTALMADLMLSWTRESPVLLAVCCDLGDVMRCALSCTSILSTMLQLTRCRLVSVRCCAGAAGCEKESRRVRAELVVRADHAGVAERGGADAVLAR